MNSKVTDWLQSRLPEVIASGYFPWQKALRSVREGAFADKRFMALVVMLNLLY